jgi:hypothetical protein
MADSDFLVPSAPFLGTLTLLWVLTGANMNSTADQAFTKVIPFTAWRMHQWRTLNASTSLTTCQGSIYDTAAKGGIIYSTATQVFTSATNAISGQLIGPTVATGLQRSATGNLFLSLTTIQGGAATADHYVYGYPEA